MSYIRSISNPEGLYIWGGKTDVQICIPGDDILKKIPISTFHELLRKFREEMEGDVGEVLEYQGAKLVFDKFGENFRWKLSYENWSILMWEVTLDYIARSRIDCHCK